MIKIIYIDTETTGFDAVKNATIQLAAILDVDGVELSRFDISMKPFEGAVVSEDALKVSGNTLETIAEFMAEAEAFAAFVEWLKVGEVLCPGVAEFAGYYNPFNARFVAALFARNEADFSEFFRTPSAEFDVLAIARRKASKFAVPNHKLGTIATHILGAEAMTKFTEVNGLHNAMTDIEVTRALHLAFKAQVAE